MGNRGVAAFPSACRCLSPLNSILGPGFLRRASQAIDGRRLRDWKKTYFDLKPKQS